MSPDALSEHLTVAEFVATQHRQYLDAQDDGFRSVEADARRFAREVFEPVRTLLGVPLRVTSGYRCGGLNHAVGGSPTSRHVLGLAADVVPVGLGIGAAFRQIAGAVRAGQLPAVDQLIEECGRWLHIGAATEAPPRGQMLVAHMDGGRMRYEPWRGA